VRSKTYSKLTTKTVKKPVRGLHIGDIFIDNLGEKI
jgi:hypothetical protein